MTAATADSLASVRQLLPESAQTMAALIGDEDTLRLIAVRGGCSIRVPEGRPGALGRKAVERLAEAVACEQLARRLMFFFAGETLYVPRCAAALDALRDHDIHRAFSAGRQDEQGRRALVFELARTYGLSDRAVWAIMDRPAPVLEDGQP